MKDSTMNNFILYYKNNIKQKLIIKKNVKGYFKDLLIAFIFSYIIESLKFFKILILKYIKLSNC